MNNGFSVTTMDPADSIDGQEAGSVPTLTVISHPNLSRIGDCTYFSFGRKNQALEISRTMTDFAPPGKLIGKPLGDLYISRSPFLLRVKKRGEIQLERMNCSTLIRANGQDVAEKVTFSSEAVSSGVVLNLAKRVVLFLHRSAPICSTRAGHGLVGNSDSINTLRGEIEKVADLKTPILLRGPSGSGKELVARAIHQMSGKGRPFVAVNMGAIPRHLAASELFGALKGSFTGADRHQLGFFRAAQGGTLFLDEIGEASPEVQVALLRTLESGEITPVGAQKPIAVHTRLIAATDADLESKMEEDSFKAPLFHRLAGYEISIPPLSQRLEDLGRLFMYFAGKELASMGETFPATAGVRPWLSAKIVEKLLFFPWPGNVRQLANVVRQLVIGCRGEPALRLVPKVEALLSEVSRSLDDYPSFEPKQRKPSEIPLDELQNILRSNAWCLKATAIQLGISRGALYQIIERTPGLRKARELSAEEIYKVLKETNGDEEAAAARFEVSLRAFRRRMTDLGIEAVGQARV
jgi:two-component system nitrogen regulation response regulator GlnG